MNIIFENITGEKKKHFTFLPFSLPVIVCLMEVFISVSRASLPVIGVHLTYLSMH